MNFRGVVFDFNGTLLWDTPLHNRAWDDFLERHGILLTDSEKDERLHGKPNDEILRNLFGKDLDGEKITAYIGEKESIYQNLFRKERMDFAPGVKDFLQFLKTSGIPHAIATSSGEENVAFYARELDLYSWFEKDRVVFHDGRMPGKPDPEIYLRAMKTIGIAPADCLIFEDSNIGLEAAVRSGAGKIIVVNSTNADRPADRFEVITDFHRVDRTIFR